MLRIVSCRGLLCAVLIFVLSVMLSACGSKSWHRGGVPGSKPYTIKGKRYVPLKSADGFVEEGIASWYGPGFHGKSTASGETYNQYAMTAAHTILPLQTKVRVTNLENGRSVIVRINDRGPFVDNRVIDLSRGAAQKAGIIGKGTGRVRIQSLSGKPKEPLLAQGGASASSGAQTVPAPVPLPARETVSAPVPVLAGAVASSASAGQPAAPEGSYGLSVEQAQPRQSVASSASSAATGTFFVQTGAFSNRKNAEKAAAELGHRGYSATIGQTPGGLWKVLAGPWTDLNIANDNLWRISRYFPSAYVVSED